MRHLRKASLGLAALLALPLALPAQARPTHHAHHGRRAAARRTPTAPAALGVKVWVNTKTGVYHFPGERWYGNTAEGEYLSESAAKAAGYRPTQNGQ